MSLKDQLSADLRDAMRAGEETRKSTIRLLITAIRNAEIPPEGAAAAQARAELDDDGVLNIVRREVSSAAIVSMPMTRPVAAIWSPRKPPN